jgi:hypothetical protein
MWRYLGTAIVLTSLAAGCGATPGGGSTPASHPSGSASPAPSETAAGNSPTGSPVTTSYCDAQDTTIPGAAAFLAGQGPIPGDLTTVQQAWFQMEASMVPACSEIVPDPPPVTTQNLTNGELSDAALQTWVTEDEMFWTLMEWAQQHGQAAFMQYLLAGGTNSAVPFVRSGGKIVDTPSCEYLEKIYAVSVTAQQMSDLTATRLDAAGIAYVGTSVGPCSSTWTTASGSGINHPVASGQEPWEVDVTTVADNSALGQYLLYEASWVQGGDTTADALIQQVASDG